MSFASDINEEKLIFGFQTGSSDLESVYDKLNRFIDVMLSQFRMLTKKY